MLPQALRAALHEEVVVTRGPREFESFDETRENPGGILFSALRDTAPPVRRGTPLPAVWSWPLQEGFLIIEYPTACPRLCAVARESPSTDARRRGVLDARIIRETRQLRRYAGCHEVATVHHAKVARREAPGAPWRHFPGGRAHRRRCSMSRNASVISGASSCLGQRDGAGRS